MKLPPVGILVLFAWALRSASGQQCGPGITTLHTVPQLGETGQLYIGDASTGHVTLKYTGAMYPSGASVPEAANWVVLVPSSGSTPIGLTVGWNPIVASQLRPGLTYSEYPVFTVGQTKVNGTCRIDLVLPPEPDPAIQSVVNAASLQPVLSPGALVSILGSHLTGPTLSTTYDFTAFYPTVVAGTSVTFNGTAAPLLYLSPDRIDAVVPFALAGQTSAQVVVQRFLQASGGFTLPLQDTAPAIFTGRQKDNHPGGILQQETAGGHFKRNRPGNPVTAGTTLRIFATGAGVWRPPSQSDVPILTASFTTQPVSLTIGGLPAKISYAETWGTFNSYSVLQVDAIVPDGLPSGPQPIVLTIGDNNNSQQQVTVGIQ